VWIALFVFGALSRTAFGDPPLPAKEVRERRLIREERPLWREALALPNRVVLLAAWPLEQALIWGEEAQLHNRIADVVLWPVRRGRSE
jgi:hypothetical protein